MSNLINKVKDAVTGDKHETANTHGTTGGTHGTSHGTSASGLTGDTTGSTTAGPHHSNVGNKVDPRIDSDRNHRGTTTGTGMTSTSTGTGMTGTGTTGYGGSTTGTTAPGHGSANAGPHNSNLSNKMDPRVDSDMDHRGTHGTTHGTGLTGGTASGSSDLDNRGARYGTTSAGTPHTSNLANTGTGITTGYGNSTVGTGRHTTATDHSATSHATPGSGTAPNTAGPHSKDLLNKMDPRVDSDLDGSKTVGGDKTHTPGSGSVAKDPTDAAQVPPSVLAQHVGDPTITHDGPQDHSRRHSTKSVDTLRDYGGGHQ